MPMNADAQSETGRRMRCSSRGECAEAVSSAGRQAGPVYGLHPEGEDPAPRPWFSRMALSAEPLVALDGGRRRHPEKRSDRAAGSPDAHLGCVFAFRYAPTL